MRSYPPLEGEGRLVWSEAKYETGWGDLSARALFEGRDPHPTPPLISFASTLPLQGGIVITVKWASFDLCCNVNLPELSCLNWI
jgi:hypothetical protein